MNGLSNIACNIAAVIICARFPRLCGRGGQVGKLCKVFFARSGCNAEFNVNGGNFPNAVQHHIKNRHVQTEIFGFARSKFVPEVNFNKAVVHINRNIGNKQVIRRFIFRRKLQHGKIIDINQFVRRNRYAIIIVKNRPADGRCP